MRIGLETVEGLIDGDLCLMKRLSTAPFLWWYHYRHIDQLKHLPPRDRVLMGAVTDWIESNYASVYDQVDCQLNQGLVSISSMEYLVRPGDVLIAQSKEEPIGYRATSRPRPRGGSTDPGEWKSVGPRQNAHKLIRRQWDVEAWTYTYTGSFKQKYAILELTIESETNDEVVDLASLKAVPLRFVDQKLREKLAQRGRTFWRCRHKRLVSHKDGAESGKLSVRAVPNIQRLLLST
jgi:hypothetical protein